METIITFMGYREWITLSRQALFTLPTATSVLHLQLCDGRNEP